jgi:hypothetical protein
MFENYNQYNNQYSHLLKILAKFNKYMHDLNYKNFRFPFDLVSSYTKVLLV